MHALMLAVMVLVMAWPSATLSVAGTAVLVTASVPCAMLSRTHPHLREHVVDLWAMALLLVVLVPDAPTGGAHGHGVLLPALPATVALLLGWAAVRYLLLRSLPPARWVLPAASAGVTATGMLAMLALCA